MATKRSKVTGLPVEVRHDEHDSEPTMVTLEQVRAGINAIHKQLREEHERVAYCRREAGNELAKAWKGFYIWDMNRPVSKDDTAERAWGIVKDTIEHPMAVWSAYDGEADLITNVYEALLEVLVDLDELAEVIGGGSPSAEPSA